jgi:hypothetical protein
MTRLWGFNILRRLTIRIAGDSGGGNKLGFPRSRGDAARARHCVTHPFDRYKPDRPPARPSPCLD